ncbi:Glycogen accumulation regulator GarA [Polystyrenella longa]|uniref:Glycogen accumulation regulator GarA n=1 Tax=Polystyrenella longa TaxID=2528007 RepID=A0A518CH55_9PLAN|nr:FHA domain-containing protein [Polystyrenella longa]QDU78556.1 Glycogen accumulation regulator GarA [Polystyrenella longa]
MLQAELIIKSGAHAGVHIPLPGTKCIIGRERDCHFRPQDDQISRHHCVIRFDGITYRVRDLGSRNGTFVNGRQIKSDVVLVPDDQIRIGSMTMQLFLSEQPPKSAAEADHLKQTDVLDGTTVHNSSLPKSSADTDQSFRLPDPRPQPSPKSE